MCNYHVVVSVCCNWQRCRTVRQTQRPDDLHRRSQRLGRVPRRSSSSAHEDWPKKYLQEIVSGFEEEWKSFVESLGTKNYKTSAKLKKFAKELKSKYKRDKDGNWNLEKLMKPFFQSKKKTSPAKKRVRQVTKPKTKRK